MQKYAASRPPTAYPTGGLEDSHFLFRRIEPKPVGNRRRLVATLRLPGFSPSACGYRTERISADFKRLLGPPKCARLVLVFGRSLAAATLADDMVATKIKCAVSCQMGFSDPLYAGSFSMSSCL